MGNEDRCLLFKRKDGKYLIYLPLGFAEDTMFPLKTKDSLEVEISFKIGNNKLTVEEWKEEDK